MNEEMQCCVVTCEKPLDKTYWDNQYQSQMTGWDLGEVSPPIKAYINSLENKNASILIPGCGNTYETEYLLQQGFSNITVIDIAPTLVEKLQEKFADNKNIKIILGDFFEHHNKYDIIIEQTFFCALPPTLRQKYVYKMHQLLNENGLLVGLLFNRSFEKNPPFGGSKEEYEKLFKDAFIFNQFDVCNNSVAPRQNTELFIEFKKNSETIVYLYGFQGITCNGCMNTVSQKFAAIPHIVNVSMSSNYQEVLIVSDAAITLKDLQNEIAYDAKYIITKINM
jgi:SAM-dependent methyltransferase